MNHGFHSILNKLAPGGLAKASAVQVNSGSLRSDLQKEKDRADAADRDLDAAIEAHAQVDAARVEAEASLPADMRDQYRRLVNSKGEDAMAEVQGEFCGGCFQQLTPNDMAELSMARAIFCRNCGRVIYLPEDRTAGR